MQMNIEIILTNLETIDHPFNKDHKLSKEDDIRSIELDGDKLIIQFNFPRQTDKSFSTFQRNLLKLLKQDLAIPKIQLNYTEPIEKKTTSRMQQLYPHAKFFAIMSGKGGVGKSTVTTLLAKELQQQGKKVAIIDADIYGASIPQILKVAKTPPTAVNNKLKPFTVDDIEIISSSLIIQDDKPIMWKGPMISRLLQQFLYDVAWSSDVDVFLFDMPPGTGDIMFALNDLLPEAKAVFVTTPQEDAAYVTIKSGLALYELDIEPIAVIENMAYINCDSCGEKNYIFDKDGGNYVAEALTLPLIQTLPLTKKLQPSFVSDAIEYLLQ